MEKLSALLAALCNKKYLFALAPLALSAAPAPAAPKLVGFHAVSDTVFRGGRPRNEAELGLLARRGIRTIVNLQGHALKLLPGEQPDAIAQEGREAERLGLRYFSLPFGTLSRFGVSDERAILEVVRVMEDPRLQPVYVHCNVGADRTGVAVAAFRILHENCGFDEAWRELVRQGELWTPLFASFSRRFLESLADHPESYGHPRSTERCPL
jgi:hypothetical protein